MNVRSILGLLILLAVAAVVAVTQFGPGLPFLGGLGGPDPLTVRGYYGGEKSRFLHNPRVVEILSNRYGITLDATKAGSVEMVTTLPAAGQDFLWPSNQVASEFHRRRGGAVVAEETIFNSPIVLYTWDVVAEVLVARSLVAGQKDGSWTVDFPGLVELIATDRHWADIGLDQLYGKVKVFSTDPRRSNSGNMFAGLLANLLNQRGVVTMQTLPDVLPRVQDYFARMGYMEHSSGDIFENFLKTGVGAKPIIVGYENQLVEFALEHQDYIEVLRDRIRTLYPVPTVWSSHPLIALNGRGKQLIEAFRDPELQRIAWEEHGFRSGLMGVENDPADLRVSGLPREITAVLPMPSADVMERIVGALEEPTGP